jgi:hypothetical protein
MRSLRSQIAHWRVVAFFVTRILQGVLPKNRPLRDAEPSRSRF